MKKYIQCFNMSGIHIFLQIVGENSNKPVLFICFIVCLIFSLEYQIAKMWNNSKTRLTEYQQIKITETFEEKY
jgi:hypothetical protein